METKQESCWEGGRDDSQEEVGEAGLCHLQEVAVGLVAQMGRGGATQQPLQGRSWGGLLCSSPLRDEMEKMQRKRLLRSKIPGTPFCLLPRAPAPWAPWEKAALCRGRAGCPCLPPLEEFALPGEFRQLQEAVAPPCSEYLMVWL